MPYSVWAACMANGTGGARVAAAELTLRAGLPSSPSLSLLMRLSQLLQYTRTSAGFVAGLPSVSSCCTVTCGCLEWLYSLRPFESCLQVRISLSRGRNLIQENERGGGSGVPARLRNKRCAGTARPWAGAGDSPCSGICTPPTAVR